MIDTLPQQKALPHSMESERAILGSVLLDSTLLTTISGRLRPEDFYSERHQVIFRAMLYLQQEQIEIDLRTLQAWLEQWDQFDRVGGLAYLSGLDLDLPDIGRVDTYAEVVRERSVRRQIIQAAGEAIRGSLDGGHGAAEAIGNLQARINAITSAASPGGGLRCASDVLEEWMTEVDENADKPKEPGLRFGIGKLDGLTGGIERRHMWLVGARPGVGKTSLLLQAIGHEAYYRERHCAVFSLEMDERELMLRMLGQLLGVKTRALRRGDMPANVWSAVIKAYQRLRQLRTLHVDQQAAIDVHTLSSRVHQLASQVPLAAVFVDYLTLMSGGAGDGYQRTAENARTLAALAKTANVRMVVAAQLSRDGNKAGRRPKLSDLRDAGEEPAWGVMLLHREEEVNAEGDVTWLSNQGEIIIAKNRTGQTGLCKVRFEGSNQTFQQAEGA